MRPVFSRSSLPSAVHVDFSQMPAGSRDDSNREGINQFVREEAAGDGRELLEVLEQADFFSKALFRQPLPEERALPGARLDGHVFERARKIRPGALHPGEEILRKEPAPRAHLNPARKAKDGRALPTSRRPGAPPGERKWGGGPDW